MPDYFIDTDANNISISCMNTVISRNTTTKNAGQSNNNNSKISTIRSILKNRASAPNLSKTGQVNFSDFRSASVLTGCVCTHPESSSTYNNCNNGKIYACLYKNTVLTLNSGSSTKIYEFRLGTSGNFITQTNDCTRTFSGKNSGSYDVVMRDGTSDANICQRVKVTLGGAKCCYKTIQDKCDPGLN